MIKRKDLYLEMCKLRHRNMPVLFFLTFAVIAAWMYWCLHDLELSRLNDVSAMVCINLLLMNTILCPIMAAALASRMCDMEQMGNTYKWLCTMQKPEHIYRGKAAAGSLYMAVFNLMQTALFGIITVPYETGGIFHLAELCLSLFISLFLTSLCIFILQLNLSLRFTNQLTPVFLSIGGTFAGLFSWFLGQWPLRYLVPWGYYAALCNIGFDYDKVTRYTTYYWDSYPVIWAAVLLIVIAVLYRRGQRHFLETVREII